MRKLIHVPLIVNYIAYQRQVMARQGPAGTSTGIPRATRALSTEADKAAKPAAGNSVVGVMVGCQTGRITPDFCKN